MLKTQNARIAAVSIAILLFVLLLFVPRSPALKSQTNSAETRLVDEEVQEAVRLMEGENPMGGILKLREILEKDPENIDASWSLGMASMQTGQFDKAVSRFEHVMAHDEQGKYFEASLFLGQAHEQLNNVPEAIESYNRFLESENEPQLMQDVRERIAVLEKKS